jgi:hypothetical protein
MKKKALLLMVMPLMAFNYSVAQTTNTLSVSLSDEPGSESDGVTESVFNSSIAGSMFNGVQNYNTSDYTPSSSDVRMDLKDMGYDYPYDTKGSQIAISSGYWIGDWSKHIVFYDGDNIYKFPDAQVGDKIRVVCKNTGWQAAGYIKSASYTEGFPGLIPSSDAFYIGGWPYFEMTLNQAALNELQNNGLCVGGFNYTICGVYLIKGTASTNSTTYNQTDGGIESWSAIHVEATNLKVNSADVQAGDVINITVNGSTSGSNTPQMQSYTSASSDGSSPVYMIGEGTTYHCIDVSDGETSHSYTIPNATIAADINTNGIWVSGRRITFEKVTTTKRASSYKESTSLQCSSSVTGTDWHNISYVAPSQFASASVGDEITVYATNVGSSAQGKLYCAGQALTRHLVAEYSDNKWNGVFHDWYDLGTSYTGYIYSKTMLHLLQTQGLYIQGKNYEVSSVTLSHSEFVNDLVNGGGFTLTTPAYTANKWYAFTLPYDVKGETEVKNLFGISDINTLSVDTLGNVKYTTNANESNRIEYQIHFKKTADYFNANTPYIIKFSSDVAAHTYTFAAKSAEERGAVTRVSTFTDNSQTSYNVVFTSMEKETGTLSTAYRSSPVACHRFSD